MGDVAPVTDALLKLENQPKLFTVIRNHFVNVLTFRTVKDHFRGPGGIDPDEFFFGYEFEDSKEETLNDLYEVASSSMLSLPFPVSLRCFSILIFG